MKGWPGTIPPARLRFMMEVIQARIPRELLDPQMLQDMAGLLHVDEANMVLHYGKKQQLSWGSLARRARRHDTQHTIGGIIVQRKSTWGAPSILSMMRGQGPDERSIFELVRHPEWIGMNRALPLMDRMSVMLFESRMKPGWVGLLIAQPHREHGEPSGECRIPAGEPRLIERILRWHGASEVRWVSTETNRR